MTAWSTLPLKDVGRWYGGGTPSKGKPEFWEGGDIPWVSPKDMTSEVLRGSRDHVTVAAVENSAARLVPSGSVALVVRSGILERTLPIAVVPFDTTLNQDMKAVLPADGIDPRWIAWALRSREHDLLATTRKAGTTVASIENSKLLSYRIPIAPPEEQRRIVEILEDHLSRLDAATAYVSTVASRLVSLDHSMLEQLFGGTDRRVRLGELIDGVEAGRSFGGSAAPAGEDEWGIIKVSAMTYGAFRATENKAIPADKADSRYEIRAGDVLVSRANTSEYVGAAVLVTDPVRPRLLLSDKSLRLKPKQAVDPAWLCATLQSPSVRKQISAGATGTKDSMRNISQSALLGVRVPDVDLERQRSALHKYDTFSANREPLAAAVSSSARRTESLRRALLAAAFSGKLTGRRTDEEVVEELTEAMG